MRLFRRTLLCLVVALILLASLPHINSALRTRRGRQAADQAWIEQRAVEFVRERPTIRIPHKGFVVSTEFHQASGLPRSPHGSLVGRPPEFGDAYNARIAELLAENGPPTWSLRRYIVPLDELVAAVKQEDLKPAEKFPFDVTPSITLFRKGTVSRWNCAASSGSDTLNILTPEAMTGSGVEPDTVYAGRLKQHPELVVVRERQNAVVLSDTGRILYWVRPADE
jgi:hypothetical protein